MAARAEVGDRRKRRDGHTWQKVGKGKWKRVSKGKKGEKRERAKAKVGEKRERRAEEEHLAGLAGSDDPKLKEAARRDGPGKRDHGDINPGDTIRIPGRGEAEVIAIESHGDPAWSSTVTFREAGVGRNYLQIPADEKIERVDQKQTNVQREREGGSAHSREVMDLAENKDPVELYEEASKEREAALGERYLRKSLRGRGGDGDLAPEPTDPRHPVRVRERIIERHLLDSLESGKIDPRGDFGKHELADRLSEMENQGYVAKDGGRYRLTPLGQDLLEGMEFEQEYVRTEGRGRFGRRRPMSEEEKKRKRREYAERYRRTKGRKKRDPEPTTDEEMEAMIAESGLGKRKGD